MLVKEIGRSVQSAIAAVIASGDWQRYEGPNGEFLAVQLAARVRQNHLQLTSSGTAALEIVLRAAGVGVGDEVILSSYDYPGNFWAIERVGARPVLVDTTADSWRIDLESLDRAYQPSCKAVVVSHLHGELQKVDELRAWCDHRRVFLFEDVCQSLGASWSGAPVGSFGHAAILSFGGGKLLSCGRGGAWATSDETLAVKARVASGAGSGPYALSELQAAAVLAQLPWLDEINLRCRTFFEALDRHLKLNRCDWSFVPHSNIDCAGFYQCGWQIDKRHTDEYRQNLLTALLNKLPDEEGTLAIPAGAGFPGFHRRSKRRCRIGGTLDHATAASCRTLVLHHRVVLEQLWTPDQLAGRIASCIARLQCARSSTTGAGGSPN